MSEFDKKRMFQEPIELLKDLLLLKLKTKLL